MVVSRSVRMGFVPAPLSPATHSSPCMTDMPDTSMMFLASMVTASASGLSRLPWQTGHGVETMYCSISSRMRSDCVSRAIRSSRGMTPS